MYTLHHVIREEGFVCDAVFTDNGKTYYNSAEDAVKAMQRIRNEDYFKVIGGSLYVAKA